MDDNETYMKMRIVKPDSWSPSRNYLTSADSELNIGKGKPLVDADEDPPIVSRPGKLRVTAATDAQEQQLKVKIRNRTDRLICLLCLVTSALIVIVAGLSIHVSQIRQSLKLMQNDLRHQCTEIETKYRSFNETKAQICKFLTSRREHACYKDWVTNKDQCYYLSTFVTSFPRSMQECSNRDSRLFEINSRDEESFVFRSIVHRNLPYWIGQCDNGNDVYGQLYKVSSGGSSCSECKSDILGDYCLHDQHHFICEKSAPCCPDIPEKIQVLCEQPEEPT